MYGPMSVMPDNSVVASALLAIESGCVCACAIQVGVQAETVIGSVLTQDTESGCFAVCYQASTVLSFGLRQGCVHREDSLLRQM